MKEPLPISLDVQRYTKLGSFIVGSLSRLSKCSFLFVDDRSFLLCLIAKELRAHEQCCLAALPCPANFIKTNVRSQDNMLKKKVLIFAGGSNNWDASSQTYVFALSS